MTLADNLLPSLSDWRPAGDGRHTWSHAVPGHGWTVHLAADRTDSLSALAWELTVERTGAAPAGLTLAGWAGRVADRVTGLPERLRVLEVDDAAGGALLRSDRPTRKGDAAFYFEVRLSGLTRAVVRRFRVGAASGSRREQVAFAATHETLATVAEGLAG